MNKFEPPAGGGRSLEKEQMKDIRYFAVKHAVTSAELFVAYQIALGISPGEVETKQPIRAEVFTLAEKMDKYMGSGLPVNRITELIVSKENYELAPNLYYKMVEIMQVTDKEKGVLRSVLEKRRSGKLIIVDPKTQTELAEINIPSDIGTEKYTQNYLAAQLISHLLEFKDRKIEIMFYSQ